MDQYFNLVRFKEDSIDESRIKFNQEFYVFRKICDSNEEIMKKLYEYFLKNNSSKLGLAALFTKYYLINEKFTEFKYFYDHYNLNKLLSFPLMDVIDEDVKNSNVNF